MWCAWLLTVFQMNVQFYYEPGTNKQFRSFKEVEKHLLSKGQNINPITPNALQENDRKKLETPPVVGLTNVSELSKSHFTFGLYLNCCFQFSYIRCNILEYTYTRRMLLGAPTQTLNQVANSQRGGGRLVLKLNVLNLTLKTGLKKLHGFLPMLGPTIGQPLLDKRRFQMTHSRLGLKLLWRSITHRIKIIITNKVDFF